MSKIKNFFIKLVNSLYFQKIIVSVFCIVISLFFGFIIMLCKSPIKAPINFWKLISGDCVNFRRVREIFHFFASMLCCSIAVILPCKTGVFNFNVVGQYIFGSFAALVFSQYFKVNWSVCVLMAAIFGAFIASISALLKIFFQINTVISGIMINWIILNFVNYSYTTFLSGIVNKNNWQIENLNYLPFRGFSVIFAVLIAIFVFILMNNTTFGFQMKASGYNFHAARCAGINYKKSIIITLMISGAIAGFGAALFYLSGTQDSWKVNSIMPPTLPFESMSVSFISQLNPIGAIFASIFASFLHFGASFMNQKIFPAEISSIINAVVIYMSGFTMLFVKLFFNVRKKIIKNESNETISTLTNIEDKNNNNIVVNNKKIKEN